VKGIVFNLLEEAVSSAYGDATWDRLLDAAGLDGAYTSLGSYDDAEIFALVRVASDALGIPPDDVLRWFGERGCRCWHGAIRRSSPTTRTCAASCSR